MTREQNLNHVLFFDLECVPQVSSFFDLDDGLKALREKKAERLGPSLGLEDASADELYDNRSGIYAEFGKVIVISVGYLAKNEEGERVLRVKSFYGDDEREVLENFFELLHTYYDKSFHKLAGHNIKDFDIPYICRRASVLGLELPNILDPRGKKPREIEHLDTLEMWRFGDRRTYVSLDLLCRVMGVETPKDDISGEQVARVYRDDKDIERVKTYCEKDVVATAKLCMKLLGDRDGVEHVEIAE